MFDHLHWPPHITKRSHINLPVASWSSSQIFTRSYPPAFQVCHLSSFAAFTWPPWSLCPAGEDNTSLYNHWPCTLEPTPFFETLLLINWWANCRCFILSGLFSSLWVSPTGSTSDWCALRKALYKCRNAIQYRKLQSLMKVEWNAIGIQWRESVEKLLSAATISFRPGDVLKRDRYFRCHSTQFLFVCCRAQ